MRDAFRVFISSDDGEWHLLTTNDSARIAGRDSTTTSTSRPASRRRGTTPSSWRQARVELADFAGQDNLRCGSTSARPAR